MKQRFIVGFFIYQSTHKPKPNDSVKGYKDGISNISRFL